MTDTSSSPVYDLVAQLVSDATMNEQKIELIAKITFGKEDGKQAVASSALIPMMISYYTSSTPLSLAFVKTLRACVVNCGAARLQCREKSLYETMIRQLREEPKEVITTLCAVCMNDDPNTELLKIVLSETNTDMKDFVNKEDTELLQRVTFLHALMA